MNFARPGLGQGMLEGWHNGIGPPALLSIFFVQHIIIERSGDE
jgi:hypothetical protein